MKSYTPTQFDIPKLEGISQKQIDEHLKLYEGYVKHTNRVLEQVHDWREKKKDERGYESAELWRRFGFEFGGMRNHEYYFGALVGGANDPDENSAFSKQIAKQFDGHDAYLEIVKTVGATRGSGWSMTYYDPVREQFLVGWVDEHHLGQLSTLEPVLAMDCWEHAYMVDYLPGERGTYMDAYLNNVNWKKVEKWFEKMV